MMKENVSLIMVQEDLEDIPNFSLPAAYALRSYRPGDELLWCEMQAAADRYNAITPELFRHQFGDDQQALAQRQFYLCDSTQAAVGTATAWYKDDFRGFPYGRIHWVAIMPEFQGRGLAKPLMTVACMRLKELGHQRAYLTTSSIRLPAINLYRQFGFVPCLRDAGDRQVWRRVLERVEKRSNLKDRQIP